MHVTELGGVNMVCGRVIFGVVACSAMFSSAASAQEARTMDFTAQAMVEHQSNVARSSEAAAQLRGIARADTIFTPSLAIDVLLPVGRQAAFLQGSVGYSFYEKNDQLNRERIDLSGGVRGRAGPCTAELHGGYARGVSQVLDANLEANVENIRETELLGVNLTCSRQTGFGLVGSVSQEWGNNDLALYKTNDYERTSYQIGVTYARPTFGTATIFGSRESSEYPNRIVGGGYDVDALGLSYQRQLGARIEGLVSFSYSRIQQSGPFAADDAETTTYSGNLSYRANNRLRFRGEFDRSVNPSSAIGGGYDLNTSYRLSADYDLGSRIRLGLAGGQSKGEARGGLPLPGNLTESTINSAVATARYMQSERLSFLLSIGRDERTANAPQFEYTDNRIGLSADVRF
ncbi:MAG: hypothetical protein EON93_14805 [Burkholderiales bacterium]|nr:MAG: hypothetical protein EON93_14805 [Burkholderiales bacterium]